MSQRLSKILPWLPGFATGLFAGRLFSELWAASMGSTALWLAVAITIATAASGAWLLSRLPLRHTWPALLLLLYVLYPENDLQMAFLAACLTAITAWQVIHPQMPGSWADLAPALILGGFFLLYWRTLAADVLPADSGEFQLVAAKLGIAHPPGFPLYTVLSHLFTRLPFGPSAAYRANLLSALTSTLTLAAVYTAINALTRRRLPALAAVLALGTATTFWAQATTANIRSMTALFTALIFLALVFFYRATREAGNAVKQADQALIAFALLLSLSLTHHASLAFLGLVAIIFVILVDPALLRTPARWWRPVLAFLLGLLPLLYLPLRATSEVQGATPALATLPGFLEHVLATGFRGDLFVYLQPNLLSERLRVMINVLSFQFSPALLGLLLIGAALLMWQEWRLAFLFGGSALVFVLVTATYRAPQTVEYMLPAYVALALLIGAGSGGLPSVRVLRLTGIRYLLVALVATLGLGQLLARTDSYAHLSGSYQVRDYANTLLENAPPDALILANWHWATPLWYLQQVEGARPDLEVRYVFPTSEPYGQTWARRIQEGLTDGRDVIATNYEHDAYASLPLAEPLGDAFHFRQGPRTSLPTNFTPINIGFGDVLTVYGYHLDRDRLAIDQTLLLTLAWQPTGEMDAATNLFAHLVDPDGRLTAQDDRPAAAQEKGLTLTQFRLAPFAGASPGAYALQIGAYAGEPLLTPDGASRPSIDTVALTPSAFAPPTQHPRNRPLIDGGDVRLIGFDRDHTLPGQSRLYLHWSTPEGYVSEIHDEGTPLFPAYAGPWGIASQRWPSFATPSDERYIPLGQGVYWTGSEPLASFLSNPVAGPMYGPVQPGQSLVLRPTFRSTEPLSSDLVISLRLIGFEEDGLHWSWWDLDDAVPAMGAIPTLKWIAGSRVRAPHFVTVDDNASPSQQVGGAITLYDAFTSRVLPLRDDRLAAQYGWIPLPLTTISK